MDILSGKSYAKEHGSKEKMFWRILPNLFPIRYLCRSRALLPICTWNAFRNGAVFMMYKLSRIGKASNPCPTDQMNQVRKEPVLWDPIL